jgi:integrase
MEGGRRSRRISIYAKTRAGVEKRLVEAVAAQHRGSAAPAPGRNTVSSYLATWIAGKRLTMERAQTLTRYEALLRLYIVPGLGGRRLADLRPSLLLEHYQHLVATGKTRSTVHHAHRVFRIALGQAVKDGLIPTNPAANLDWGRPRPPEMHTLNPAEVTRLLEAARPWDRELFRLATYTGMRSGELLALQWSAVELEGAEPCLHVTRTLLAVRGREPVTGEPKTARSRRRIELSPPVVEARRAPRRQLVEERVRLANVWEDHDLVFPSWRGTPRRRANVTRDLHAALDRAGLQRIRFHDLRHTAATLLLGRVNPKAVADMLGHADVGITLNLYSHSSRTMHREAANAMAEVMAGR